MCVCVFFFTVKVAGVAAVKVAAGVAFVIAARSARVASVIAAGVAAFVMSSALKSMSEPEFVRFVSAQPLEVDNGEPVLVQTAAARACKTVQRMMDGSAAHGEYPEYTGQPGYAGHPDYAACPGHADDPGDVSISEDDSDDSLDSDEPNSLAADCAIARQGASNSAAPTGAGAPEGGGMMDAGTKAAVFPCVIVEGNRLSIRTIATFLHRTQTHGYISSVPFDPQQKPVFSDTVLNVRRRPAGVAVCSLGV